MSYAIRLTFTYQQMEKVVKRICDDADVVVVYEHDESARKHIHLYTEGTKTSVQTIKNWVTKDLGCKVDKADWSFKTAKDRRFITYMAKGKLQPCLVKGISDDEINTLREKWVEPIRIEKEKKEEPTLYQLSKQLSDWMNNHTSEVMLWNGQLMEESPLTSHDIVLKTIEIHNKYNKSYTDFSLIRSIHTAFGLSSRKKWRDMLIEKVISKL